MYRCPVCKNQNNTLRCPHCGFDGSRDYRRFPTLAMIPEAARAVDSSEVRHGAHLICPNCGGAGFAVYFDGHPLSCLQCGKRMSMNQAEEQRTHYNQELARLSGLLRNSADTVSMDDNGAEEDTKSELPNRIITLHDENGQGMDFEFLDLIEYNGAYYVVLLPAEETEEASEVIILQLEESDSEDEESYVGVEDDRILNAVFEIFKEKAKDEFNFID